MKIFLPLLLLFIPIFLFAQVPDNDDCTGVIDIGQVPYCATGDAFFNVNASSTDIGYGNMPVQCNAATNAAQDVWFEFTTADTIVDYSISITGVSSGSFPPIQNPVVIIYRGDCQFDGLLEIGCAVAEVGATSVELQFNGLSLGTTYFLRVFDANGLPTEAGAFELCIDEIEDDYTIADNNSTASTGTIFDSGGPDGNYGDNENLVFTICPNEFHQCLDFVMQYYNFETGDYFYGTQGDILNFYDGPDTNSPLITSLGGAALGYYYLFNNSMSDGGVCFPIKATSGCLTLEFISDDINNFEGFAGSWSVSLDECIENEAISVNESIEDTAIEGLLSSPTSTVTVKSITCADGAYGTFSASDNSDLGLENGLILSSGYINIAIGPNDTGDSGGFYDGELNTLGDDDLDALSLLFGDGTVSEDACIVELEVFAATNELNFEYIFGSDEYPEFVNDIYNDIFAFFISGPGITGLPQLNNQENIAILPNTNTPVEINSVNNVSNWEYYRNNNTIYNESTEFDGLTSGYLGNKKSLTASAIVEPCNTYNLKLAIADRGDNAYNSGVFIGEITGGQPEITFSSFFGVDELIESCSGEQDSIFININGNIAETTSYQIQVSGTATRDVDYILDMPDLLTINPGDTELGFSIIPLPDGTMEGPETIIIELIADFGCGSFSQGILTIDLKDNIDLEVGLGQDTLALCSGSTLELTASGAAEYYWTPLDIVDNPIASTVVISPTESGWVYVNGEIGICSDTDSVYINLTDANLEITALSPTTICQGESVELATMTNLTGIISWSPIEGLDNPSSPNPTAIPNQSTTYTATIMDNNCVATDQVIITVDQLDFPNLINDATICRGENIRLSESTGSSNTQYSWTPSNSLDNANIANPTATPLENTTYTLNATSTNGVCNETATVNITVIDPMLELAFTDTLICSNESLVLQALSGDSFEWAPSDGLSCTDCPNPTVNNLTEATVYTVTATFDDCIATDSVSIDFKEGVFLNLTNTPSGDELLLGCEVEIMVENVSDSSVLVNFYNWTVDGVSLPDEGDVINFLANNEAHNITVSATGSNGCVGLSTLPINPESSLPRLPNLITPNNDGLNDYFTFIDECAFPVLRFEVYNRWGKLVYQNDTPSTGWDGKYAEEFVPQDVYLYIIELQLPNQVETFTGDVTVLR